VPGEEGLVAFSGLEDGNRLSAEPANLFRHLGHRRNDDGKNRDAGHHDGKAGVCNDHRLGLQLQGRLDRQAHLNRLLHRCLNALLLKKNLAGFPVQAFNRRA
jgi:hypothetical protein